MRRRQSSTPRQWLIADERLGGELWNALDRLPRGSGVLLMHRNLRKAERARLLTKLRREARRRNLTIVDEAAGGAARVHNMRELRQAASAGAPLLFLSPLFPTRSHPDWTPLPRMRAATLARLSPVPVIALGGMDVRRFRRVQRLGFYGWAGIDAWMLRT
ncbi:MAG TPA: thiamine phosphate synthase [Sphingomicrobium sp.]|jgi:thiamine-phosphate pyrophosphorylase|nr:thiamine phosphate synthase [Sphingomicrobium sp.]